MMRHLNPTGYLVSYGLGVTYIDPEMVNTDVGTLLRLNVRGPHHHQRVVSFGCGA